MKFVITLLMISFSSVVFGQMTFNSIIEIYKMDMDQFEDYTISRRYEFHEFQKNEYYNGVTYVKGLGKETKYLTLYDKYFNNGKSVSFQTANSSELLKIKREMKKSGYTLFKSSFPDNNTTKFDEYRNEEFEVAIATSPSNEKNKYVTYEISFNKF